VTSLARIITGWTFAGRAGTARHAGSFVFNAMRTSRGPQLLLGKLTKQWRRAGRSGA